MKKVSILDEETLFAVSEIFKALGDPTRIKILSLLCEGNTVNEISKKGFDAICHSPSTQDIEDPEACKIQKRKRACIIRSTTNMS